MVTCNEIRIGNLIFFSPTWKSSPIKPRLVKVKRIYEKSCIVIDMGLDLELAYESASTQPIPLTEDWLLKFGGEKVDRLIYSDHPAYIWGKDWKGLIFSGGYLHKPTPNNSFMIMNQTKIEFVHAFQNAMFALTGQELIITQDTKNG